MQWPEPVQLLIRAAVESHAADPDLHRVLLSEMARVGRLESLEAFEQATISGLASLLEHHRDSIEVSNTYANAFLLVHTTDAIIHRALLEDAGDLNWSTVENELHRLFLAYLS